MNDSTAYDSGYQIGYFIGSYLPFILIASAMIIVWILANRKRKRIEKESE
jgi:large-conductance mechanosensitive channel